MIWIEIAVLLRYLTDYTQRGKWLDKVPLQIYKLKVDTQYLTYQWENHKMPQWFLNDYIKKQLEGQLIDSQRLIQEIKNSHEKET